MEKFKMQTTDIEGDETLLLFITTSPPSKTHKYKQGFADQIPFGGLSVSRRLLSYRLLFFHFGGIS